MNPNDEESQRHEGSRTKRIEQRKEKKNKDKDNKQHKDRRLCVRLRSSTCVMCGFYLLFFMGETKNEITKWR
jgi:hypothetical protein